MQGVHSNCSKDLLHGIHSDGSDGHGQGSEFHQVPEVLEILQSLFSDLVTFVDHEVDDEANIDQLHQENDHTESTDVTG